MKLKLFIPQLSTVDMSQFPKTRLNVLLITAIWEKRWKHQVIEKLSWSRFV